MINAKSMDRIKARKLIGIILLFRVPDDVMRDPSKFISELMTLGQYRRE